jgi:hypothetical protein
MLFSVMKVLEDKWTSAQFAYPFRKTCAQCKSELEIEKGDVQSKTGQNQFDATYTYFVVMCPLCKYVQMVEPQKQ